MAKKEKKQKKENKEKKLKVKKEKKNKKSKSQVEESLNEQEILEPNPENIEQEDEIQEVEEESDEGLTESQKAKREKLKSVKNKISKILKSANVEIVDENAGDEFDDEESSDSEIKKQQDYDSLKSVFGKDGRGKKQELTLTIDDFDYTYVGKYVDEYDLMHKKNIKKIKLPSKYAKVIKRISIAVLIVAVLVVGIVLGIKLTSEKPYYLVSVSLSQSEQTYFAGESFDFTGLYLYAKYSNGKNSYTETLKLKKEYYTAVGSEGSFTNVNNVFTFLSGGSKATLAFTYGNAKCQINIKIEQKESESLTVKYTNGIFNLKQGEEISVKNLFALIDYSNYNSELLNLSSVRVSIDGTNLDYNANTKSFAVTSDLSEDSVITVKYGSYSVNLIYVEDSTGVNVVCSKVA